MGTPIPTNAARFSLAEILEATGGTVRAPGDLERAGTLSSVSTDTRTLASGALFVALRGEAFDAHDHLAAAAASGARAAIVERVVPAPAGLAIIEVKSSLDALGALGRVHARRWRALGGERRIVGVTGSAGKTTTRVAIRALLEQLRPGEVLATRGNLNNRVGLPMVLFGLQETHRLAVVEMGMNQPGEIEALASVAEADAGVVTLVAAAHVEGVGSIEGVAHEKGALFRALSPAGIAIANGDDSRVMAEMERSPARRRVRYGRAEGLEVRVVAREPEGLTLSRVTIERPDGSRIVFRTPLIGEAGALACAAAVAVVEGLLGEPVSGEVAEAAFGRADVGGGGGRLVPRLLGGDVAVIDDTYNANPASSCASIRTAAELARASGRRLVLVLGAMFELGHESERGHDEVGRAAAGSGAAEVFAVHGDARRISDRASASGLPARFYETSAEAAPAVVASVRPGDLLLVKGSRGVGTERVVRALVEVRGAEGSGAEVEP
jgi:UDP-N-acetylmuramoyl-tripeptide--D-alanyl-D-alanine ligase